MSYFEREYDDLEAIQTILIKRMSDFDGRYNDFEANSNEMSEFEITMILKQIRMR